MTRQKTLPADGDSRTCASCDGVAVFNRSTLEGDAARFRNPKETPEAAWYCPDCGGEEPWEE